jgi:hypothetical protein
MTYVVVGCRAKHTYIKIVSTHGWATTTTSKTAIVEIMNSRKARCLPIAYGQLKPRIHPVLLLQLIMRSQCNLIFCPQVSRSNYRVRIYVQKIIERFKYAFHSHLLKYNHTLRTFLQCMSTVLLSSPDGIRRVRQNRFIFISDGTNS